MGRNLHDVENAELALLKYVKVGLSQEEIRRAMTIKKDLFKVLFEKLVHNGLIQIDDTTVTLTPKGHEALRNEKQLSSWCKNCLGTGIFQSVNERIVSISNLRPKPDITIDQCPIKPRDLIRRVNLIHERGDIDNKRIACVGDSDFCSLAMAEVGRPEEICVIDIDERTLKTITEISKERDFPITCVKFDVRRVLKGDYPEGLAESCDIFETDPPYTDVGMKLFAYVGMKALKREGVGYITVPYLPLEGWSADLIYQVQRLLVDAGFVITDCIRGFHVCEHEEEILASMIRATRITYKEPFLEPRSIDLRKMYTFR